MLRNYLKTAWRNILKRKYYSVLNILGLSLSIVCCMFLYLFIQFHSGFDRYHKNAASTYRIVNELYFEKTAYIKGASMAMYRELLTGNPDIRYVNLMLNDYPFTVSVKNQIGVDQPYKEDGNIAIVSPDWFGMFDYRFLAGSPDGLKFPNTAVVTQSVASKYFGSYNPVGQIILFPDNKPVKIIGVISDAPYNSDLRSGIFVSLLSLRSLFPNEDSRYFTDWSWIDTHISLFVTLNNIKSRSTVEAGINDMAKAHLGGNANYYHFLLQPLSEVHFDSNYGGSVQKRLLIMLIIIGLCIVAISSFNYMNSSIAQQSGRMVEIGTRKALGASTWSLFIQFIIEIFLTNIISIVIAIILFILSFSIVNHTLFAASPLYAPSIESVLLFSMILLFFLGAISGIYPAVTLSGISVLRALKNVSGSWKAGTFRKSLIVAQNLVACLLTICTVTMIMQVRFLKRTQIGFNSNAVVMVPLPDTTAIKMDFISNKFSAIPEIRAYSFCHFSPSSKNDWGGSVKFVERPNWESWKGGTEVGDSAYIRTFGLQLIAGRNTRTGKSPEFLVNEAMVKKSGFKNPYDVLGKQFIIGEFGDLNGTIVGVVKDFNTQSLLVPIEPVVIVDWPQKYSAIAVRLAGPDMHTAIADIKKTWEQTFPNELFEYHFTDDQIADLYQQQDLQQRLIWIAAAVAIVISCLGLIGVVSLTASKRTKEIGIRKVLGASNAGIVKIISKDFLKLIFIAIAIAIPLSWLIMYHWLQNFAYHINISWWILVLSAVSALSISLLTVVSQSIKTALANPVDSLRAE